MSSERADHAFVWIWLPGASSPVVAGRLDRRADELSFVYGAGYLSRPDAIPIYEPELPLVERRLRPLPGLSAPGCILDAGPDAWGQRVIMNRLAREGRQEDPDRLALLLLSGSDRAGALDFQPSPDQYSPRGRAHGTLEELQTAAERVEEGIPLSPELDAALLRGSSIGGARPKALLDDGGRRLIAKFSSTTDTYPVVQGEFVAMELARRAGLDVAPVELAEAMGRKVMLVERFDRPGEGRRRPVVSALTILELDELAARWASYYELAQAIRRRFTDAAAALRELFARIAFNILVGNNDDHARNHAAFWNGEWLALTPAYDVCPQSRSVGRVTQAMVIGDDQDPYKESQLSGLVERAPLYQLSSKEAREIVDGQIAVVERDWEEVCDLAGLSEVERKSFWGRQFLNPYALEGYGGTSAAF